LPVVALAVNTGEAATPRLSVVAVAVFAPPVNVPPAPDIGAVNVTIAPLVGDPPVVTNASRRAVNAAPAAVLCPDPLSTAIDTAGCVGVLLLLEPHAISVEIMPSRKRKRIDWPAFIALHPVQS
jgi:hypothetical protein